MNETNAAIAALTSLMLAVAGFIGALVTWRKASNERTVSDAALVTDRMKRQDERMDKMQAVIDRLRRREQILVDYVYGLQGQIVRLGGEPRPWPTALNDTGERQ